MKLKAQNRLLFIISVIVYLIALIGYAFWNYARHKKEILENIDTKLYNSAVVLKYILPDDFHDRAIDAQAISINEDKYIANKLTKLIKETGYKFTYTIIKKGDTLFFIASDIVADPKNKRGTFYFYPYEEADESFLKAFGKDTPTYKTVSDQWGTVRTVMIPEKSPGGVNYLACADYDISYVNGLLQKNFLGSIATVLLFLFLSVPIILIYNKSLRNYIAALGESEEKWRSLTENSPDHIMLLDLNYNILFINHTVPDLTIENVIGKSYLDFVPPDQHQTAIDCFMRVIHSGKAEPYDTNYITTGEETRHFNVRIAPVMDKDGSITGFVSSSTNVTESKRVEADRERLLSAIEQASETVVITDYDGNIQYTNPAFERITGYSREEVIGANPRILKSGQQDASYYRKMWQTITSGDTWTGKLINRKKDGSFYTEEVSISPVLDKAGKIMNFVAVKRDITDEIKMEKRLQQAQKMEAIGSLAGGIAHDFNNILSSIIGFTELALDDVEKNTNIADCLQEVYSAGKRAKDLVKQILAFARQSDEEIKPIRLRVIAEEVLNLIRSSIPATIEIRQNIASDSFINGSETQVHQILMNLCTNAAHAMEDKGGIMEMNLKDVVIDGKSTTKKMRIKPGNYIETKISDTGAGIPPDIIGSIFEPYFTTKPPGEGTGMGLAVVHGIVESYGGYISVDSTVGMGSVFTILFPVTRKRQTHTPYEPGELPPGTERILFVDDEPAIAKMGSQILEQLGYSVTNRTSSVEALELFRSKPNDFDLVITDMTMPNMTGDELAAELMEIRPDIPVILCTGYSKKISDETVSEIGIKAFAYKPIVKADLAKTVRKVLDEAKGSAQGLSER